MTENNPLLALLVDHQPLPFDRTRPEHIQPAVNAGLTKAREAILRITGNPDSPTFDNTVLALEAADEGLDRVTSVFYHLLHVEASEALQELATVLPQQLSEFRNDIVMNKELFERLIAVEESAEELDAEQAMVLEDLLVSFRRNGASLSEEDQTTLRKLDHKLSTCAPKFAEHVLKATQAYSLWVSDKADIEGLPASAISTAKQAATAEGREAEWKFTLDAPSYLAFMTFSPNGDLRKSMWEAYSSRCVQGEFQNLDLIRTILRLRNERATLLGYTHHVHYTLERRMARDLETLEAFYNELFPIVMPAARKDLEQVKACKRDEQGPCDFYPWDMAYYSEQLRQKEFDLKQEELRPWFEFDATLNMIFEVCGRLFDLGFESDPTLPVYREDLYTYRVFKKTDGRDIGQLFIDPFPRSTKRPGAWMNALVGQGMWQGQVRRPLVGIVGSLTPPSEDQPSLLTMDEARTLFHEFGHALHELLSQCRYRSVAGTHVRWDFVELPSQLLENWLLEPEFLRNFPKHYQTGESLPESLIEKVQASKTFLKGYQSARQLSFGKLDLGWYTTPPDDLGEDVIAFERKQLEDCQLFDPQPGTALSPSFQHIFSGGYASGYYSYKWAEVLEADVFEVFKENGLFDPETAQRLESTILSKGGSRPPEDLFRDFLGRDPDPDALLRRDGLL